MQFINYPSIIIIILKVKMLPKASQRLSKESLHKKQILKEMPFTLQKINSLHLTPKLSQQLQQQAQFSRFIQGIMQKNDKNEDNSKINNSSLSKSRLTRKSQVSNMAKSKGAELQKLQIKVAKMKKKIEGNNNFGSVQNQLNEIIYIKNGGEKCNELNLANSRLLPNKELKNGRRITEQDVVSNFWSELEHRAHMNKKTICRIKQNRIDMMIKQNIQSEEDEKEINEIKKSFTKNALRESLNFRNSVVQMRHETSLSTSIVKHRNELLHDTSPAKALNPIKNNYQPAPKEIFENNLIDYLKNKSEKKRFLKSMNKEILEKEKASKIYSFIKGGYDLDSSDIEGEYISLRRFNNCKEQFNTLNQIYRTVKNSSFISQKEQINSKLDESFKSLVYINEMSSKVSPTQLHKIMKHCKIVR